MAEQPSVWIIETRSKFGTYAGVWQSPDIHYKTKGRAEAQIAFRRSRDIATEYRVVEYHRVEEEKKP